MKIAIRMDDITPDMDWGNFGKFKELLDEFKVKPLIGVVPDNRDENLNRNETQKEAPALFWQKVKEWQEGGWIVALHGFQHVYTQKKGGCFPLNRFSEFAGLPFGKQKELLNEGTDILTAHGIRTDIFMAPAHSYDRNTLRALKELGYTKITDGFGNRPYERDGLVFYPISFRLSASLKKKSGTTTMVVHTNTVTEAELAGYRRIFESGSVISYGEYLEIPPVHRRITGRMTEYLMAFVKRFFVKLL